MQKNNYNNIGLLLLRVGAGLFMLFPHGYNKLMKLLAGGTIKFADPIGLGADISLWLAVFAEVVCSILLIIGFKTRLVSIPLAFTMAVAAFVVHGGDPWGKKELAVVYLLIYIVLMFTGGGKYSVDEVLNKRNTV